MAGLRAGATSGVLTFFDLRTAPHNASRIQCPTSRDAHRKAKGRPREYVMQ